MGRNRHWPKLRSDTVYVRQGGGRTDWLRQKPPETYLEWPIYRRDVKPALWHYLGRCLKFTADSHLFCALIHAAAGPSFPVALTHTGGQQLTPPWSVHRTLDTCVPVAALPATHVSLFVWRTKVDLHCTAVLNFDPWFVTQSGKCFKTQQCHRLSDQNNNVHRLRCEVRERLQTGTGWNGQYPVGEYQQNTVVSKPETDSRSHGTAHSNIQLFLCYIRTQLYNWNPTYGVSVHSGSRRRTLRD